MIYGDIAPTVLEIAGLPGPKVVNGVPQTPIEGISLAYTFNDAHAAERHDTVDRTDERVDDRQDRRRD